jgi:membrane protein
MLERALQFVRRLLQFCRNVIVALDQHDAMTIASAMAYSFFLSLVPLLLLVGYLLGVVVRAHGLHSILRPLIDATPTGARALVEGELYALAGSGAALAPLVGLGFLWASSSGVHGLLDGLEIVLRSERRPWWRKRGAAIACTILGIFALFTLGSLMSVVRFVVPPGYRRLVLTLLLLAAGTTILSGFYRHAVRKAKTLQRRAWPGAFVAVASWVAVTLGFGAYANSLANYSVYYGSLAAVAILLLWCWLSALALLLGAEVNAQLEARHTK